MLDLNNISIKQEYFTILYCLNKYPDLKYFVGQSLKNFSLDNSILSQTIKAMLNGSLNNCDSLIHNIMSEPSIYVDIPDISSIDTAKHAISEAINKLQQEFLDITLPNIIKNKPNKEAKIHVLKKIVDEFNIYEQDLLYDREIVFQKLEDYVNGVEEIYLTPWNNINVNLSIKGLPKSHLITIAADTGVGKTLFTMQLVDYISKTYNVRSAYFSLEMPMHEMLLRQSMLYSETITTSELYNRLVPENKRFEMYEIFNSVKDSLVYIYDSFCEYNKIASVITELARLDFKVIAIDLLQLIKYSAVNMSERERIDYITSDLKRLVNKHNILIILVSHLHRREDLKLKNSVKSVAREPTLSDLKGASGIEQNSDKVILLYDPNIKHNDEARNELSVNRYIKVLVRKDRVGQPFSTWLCHNTKLHRLIDADPYHDYDSLIIESNIK